MQAFDVIIAGGGLSGLTQALALSTLNDKQGKPLQIAVVDQGALQASAAISGGAPADARVLALSYGSVAYLTELGLWSEVSAQAMAINNIHVSDLGHYGKARLYAKDYHREALGYVIELDVLQNALLTMLQQCQQVSLIGKSQITAIKYQKDDVTVTLNEKDTLKAQLLLGCDGAQSPTRQIAGIETKEQYYQQVAVISNVVTERPHNGRAYERFTDSGPLAMLPMRDLANAKADCSFSLVWTVSPEQAQTLMALDDDTFCQQLTERFGLWQGLVVSASKRFSYPLKLVQVNELIRHRFALVGNAAHTLHPIAGQGFNLGVRDIVKLHHLIAEALASDQDIGNLKMLMGYQQARLEDHKKVIGLTDTLVHTYSNQHLPLVIGRNLGVKALNYITPVKNAFARFTMGQS